MWFHDSDHGAARDRPDGPDAPVRYHRIRANTALVLDTDSVFHGVDRVTDDAVSVVPPVRPTTVLVPRDHGWELVDDDGAGPVVATYRFEELRFSVPWKADRFADEADRDRWRTGNDGLDLDSVLAAAGGRPRRARRAHRRPARSPPRSHPHRHLHPVPRDRRLIEGHRQATGPRPHPGVGTLSARTGGDR